MVQQYSGTYVIDPNFPTLEISFDGRKLVLDQQGGETAEFYATSDSTFYMLGVDYQLEFVPGDNGSLMLLVNMHGNVYPFAKQ